MEGHVQGSSLLTASLAPRTLSSFLALLNVPNKTEKAPLLLVFRSNFRRVRSGRAVVIEDDAFSVTVVLGGADDSGSDVGWGVGETL